MNSFAHNHSSGGRARPFKPGDRFPSVVHQTMELVPMRSRSKKSRDQSTPLVESCLNFLHNVVVVRTRQMDSMEDVAQEWGRLENACLLIFRALQKRGFKQSDPIVKAVLEWCQIAAEVRQGHTFPQHGA